MKDKKVKSSLLGTLAFGNRYPQGRYVLVFGPDGQARQGGTMWAMSGCVEIRRENGPSLILHPGLRDMWSNIGTGLQFALFTE